MNDKVYCGSGKKQKDNWLKASICLTDLDGHTFEYNGKKYAKVNININDTPNQYGKDVSISVDTWKPEENNTPTVDTSNDMPF